MTCPICGEDVDTVWSDWSDRFLCHPCADKENELHMKVEEVVNPPSFWEGRYGAIVLSKVQGWAMDGQSLKVFMDFSDRPFTVALYEAKSFTQAFREYWT